MISSHKVVDSYGIVWKTIEGNDPLPFIKKVGRYFFSISERINFNTNYYQLFAPL